jgi:WD40 repeat protein
VTGIEFLNLNLAMVTTNDSRIRFIDIRSGKVIYKIKGHKNEAFPVRASLSDDLQHVICGSEDGEVYMWSQILCTVVAMSKKGLFGKLLTTDKSDVCEYFQPSKNA